MAKNDEIYHELGIATRMRRFIELISADGNRLYDEVAAPFKVSYFYVMYPLVQRGSMPIAEIAKYAGCSHSAVSQTIKKMLAEGLVETTSTEDGRQKLVSLNAEGKRVTQSLKPLWLAIEKTVKDLIKESGVDFLGAITRMEASLHKTSFYDRIQHHLTAKPTSEFTIEPYHVRYKQAFYDLNIAWVKQFFTVEPVDQTMLSDPEGTILACGGEIYFAVKDGKAVGAVALKTSGNGVFELSKLAVDSSVQQGGMGKALCQAVIDRFQARGGTKLYLETNSLLESAIRLYQKLDFKKMPLPENSPYERVNYYMEWQPEEKQ